MCYFNYSVFSYIFTNFASKSLFLKQINEPFRLGNAYNLTQTFFCNNFNNKMLLNFLFISVTCVKFDKFLKTKWFIDFFPINLNLLFIFIKSNIRFNKCFIQRKENNKYVCNNWADKWYLHGSERVNLIFFRNRNKIWLLTWKHRQMPWRRLKQIEVGLQFLFPRQEVFLYQCMCGCSFGCMEFLKYLDSDIWSGLPSILKSWINIMV